MSTPSLTEVFSLTISPDPASRKQAENFLCSTISSNPRSALDILQFAADWNVNNNNNSNSSENIWSRLAAAIFLKNMILHSPWGSGLSREKQRERFLQRESQNQNNQTNNFQSSAESMAASFSSGNSAMFSGFLPDPDLQSEIRNQLVAAMFSWRPDSSSSNSSEKSQGSSSSSSSSSSSPNYNVEETIRRYLETAVECVHDVDWPDNWQELFPQAISEFSQNGPQSCFELLTQFSSFLSSSSSSNNNNSNNSKITNNFFSSGNNNNNNNNFLSNIHQIAESLHRASTALVIIKLCCKRTFNFNNDNNADVLGNSSKGYYKKGFSSVPSSKMLTEKFIRENLLQPLGEKVFIPFVEICNNENWSKLFLHLNFELMRISNSNNSNEQQQQQQQDSASLLHLLQTLQKSWLTFSYEGMKALFHISQTQIYQSLLDATVSSSSSGREGGEQIPFLFATIKACMKIHHALFSRVIVRRELHLCQFISSSQNQEGESGVDPQLVEKIFQHENRKEIQFWRLWKCVWNLTHHIFDHYADVDSVPKRIRKGHRDWVIENFAPVLSCAVAMGILFDNRPTFVLTEIFSSSKEPQQNLTSDLFYNFADNFLCPLLVENCETPGYFAVETILKNFIKITCVQKEAINNNNNILPLPLVPFRTGSEIKSNSEALGYAMDCIEVSLRFIPWFWFGDFLFSPMASNGKVSNENENNNKSGAEIYYDLVTSNSNESISPLFLATANNFNTLTGSFSWCFIVWLLIPRLALDRDEVEQFEINPSEYLMSQTDVTGGASSSSSGGGSHNNSGLFSMRSTASRILTLFIMAKCNDKQSKKNRRLLKQQQQQQSNNNKKQQENEDNPAKNRIHFIIDFALDMLFKAINGDNDNNSNDNNSCVNLDFSPNPQHLVPPPLLAADAGLQLIRICKKAMGERSDGEKAIMNCILPLFQSRCGPVRAKAAQVASELCQSIQWHGGESTFQQVLKGALDLMYDRQLPVRMLVCQRLSPLIRHELAGTIVVPHLARIVGQFFEIMEQNNQSDTVVRTLRKLFAHYREHMAEGACELTSIIMQRFSHVVEELRKMDQDDIAEEVAEQNEANVTEFNQVVSSSSTNNKNDKNSSMQKDLIEITAVGDELLGAISTIVKCVPPPDYSVQQNSNNESNNNENSLEKQQRQNQATKETTIQLQKLLSPMICDMFECANFFGFFEGGLKLITNLLTRCERPLLPETWNIFTSLFRIVVVRNSTDYFSNMISALDNFASVDPQMLLAGKRSNNNSSSSNNNNNPQHPAENETFMVQALEIVKAVCQNIHIPLSDVANAVQCVDIFLLNAARCLNHTIVANFSSSNSSNSNQKQQNEIEPGSIDQLCEITQNEDPVQLKNFLDIPIIVSNTRQRLLPSQCQKMNLPATPSMCLLLSNNVFCVLLTATPQVISTQPLLQQRAILSFNMVSHLFDQFNGVFSGEYKKYQEQAKQAMHFRLYDRKLYLLSLSQFLQHVFFSSSSSDESMFQSLQEQGYSNEKDATNLFSQIIRCGILMCLENSFFDCRLLSSIEEAVQQQQQQQESQNQNNNNEQQQQACSRNTNNNEFFKDVSEDDFSSGDDDTDDTDVTTDSDWDDDLDLFGGDDNSDDDTDDENYDYEAEYDENNENEGGESKNATIQKLAAQAAAARRGNNDNENNNNNDDDEDEDEDFLQPDDISENLLLEDPGDKVTTPIDFLDEYSIFGQTLEKILSFSEEKKSQIQTLLQNSVSNVVNSELGQVPVSRYKNNNSSSASNINNKRNRKKLLKQQQQQSQQQQNRGELVFALHRHHQEEGKMLSLPEFLRECSQQRNAIDTAVF